jgi:hypothetical protein
MNVRPIFGRKKFANYGGQGSKISLSIGVCVCHAACFPQCGSETKLERQAVCSKMDKS